MNNRCRIKLKFWWVFTAFVFLSISNLQAQPATLKPILKYTINNIFLSICIISNIYYKLKMLQNNDKKIIVLLHKNTDNLCIYKFEIQNNLLAINIGIYGERIEDSSLIKDYSITNIINIITIHF